MAYQERHTKPLDGHSFKDSCEWLELPGGLLYDFHRLVHDFREIGRPDFYSDCLSNLVDFLDSDEGKPIKTLGTGDTFRIEDYPKGTIVRFGIDLDEPIGLWKRKLRHHEESWGVITQVNFAGNYFDCLIGWSFDKESKVDPYSPEHQYSNYRYSNIVVGETLHTKIVEPTVNPVAILLRFNKWQYLLRFNWVEIWKFGTGIREKDPEPAIGNLLPESMQQV